MFSQTHKQSFPNFLSFYYYCIKADYIPQEYTCVGQMDKTKCYHRNKIFNAMANFIVDLEVSALMTRFKILFPFDVHNENLFLRNIISLTLARWQDKFSKVISSTHHIHAASKPLQWLLQIILAYSCILLIFMA